MTQLTPLNALFTYSERCKQASIIFTEQANSMESRQFKDCQEYWAKLIADSWQVEIVDMLAETNTLTNGANMTQEQFNNKVVAIANRIANVWKYSYTRQGFKYDARNPQRFLNASERDMVETLKAEMDQLTTDFMENK